MIHNAAHRGAETEIFPFVRGTTPGGELHVNPLAFRFAGRAPGPATGAS
jgi:hypothetical protein